MKACSQLCFLITLLSWVFTAASPRAYAQKSAPAKAASALDGNWEEIDDRLIFLMVRLANVEASLEAVEKAISANSYRKLARIGDAKRAEKGNEAMDRKGGGPMKWHQFYGTTAEKFFYHPVDARTTYHTTTVLTQQSPQSTSKTNDNVPSYQGVPAHQRPPQFDYIYRANRDAQSRAEKEAAELANKIEALLARRASLEEEQSKLWCEIAFRAVARHDLDRKPLYRFELAAPSTETADRERAEAMKAAADFVRKSLSIVAAAESDQASAFGGIKATIATAREQFDDHWVRHAFLTPDRMDAKTAPGKFTALAKRLENIASNLADSYQVSVDGDRFRDEQRKDTFRALLQQSLVMYAEIVLALDEMASALAAEWKLKPNLDRPLARSTLPPVQRANGQAAAIVPPATDQRLRIQVGNLTDLRPALVVYYPLDELLPAEGKKAQVTNYGKGPSLGTAESCALVPGRFGKAAAFDGRDSQLFTGADWRAASTVSFWVNIHDRPEGYYLLSSTGGGGGAFTIQRWSGTEPPRFELHSRGNWISKPLASGLTDDEWHHVVIVLERDSNQVRFFADGKWVQNVDLPLNEGTWDGQVGISNSWGGRALRGEVDDFAVFDQTLNAEQIFHIFDAGCQGSSLGQLIGLDARSGKKQTTMGPAQPATSSTALSKAVPGWELSTDSNRLLHLSFDDNTVRPPSDDGTVDILGALSRQKMAVAKDVEHVDGYRGKGLGFNGTSSVLRTDIPQVNVRTVALHMKVRSFEEPFRLLMSREGTGQEFGIYCGLPPHVTARQFSVGVWNGQYRTAGPMPWDHPAFDHHLAKDQWHYVVFSFDWLNGRLLYAVDGKPTEPVLLQPNTDPFTGKFTISSGFQDTALNGVIDDVIVTSTIVTAGDINGGSEKWQRLKQPTETLGSGSLSRPTVAGAAAKIKSPFQLPATVMSLSFDEDSVGTISNEGWVDIRDSITNRKIAAGHDVQIADGYRAKGLSFNGVRSFLRTDIAIEDAKTVALWLKLRTLNEPFHLLSYWSGNTGLSLQTSDNNRQLELAWPSGAKWSGMAFDHDLVVSKWHHLLFSFDWRRGRFLYAVDGKPNLPITIPPRTEAFAGNLLISTPWMDRSFDGVIDDFVVSSAIVSPEEVRAAWAKSQR